MPQDIGYIRKISGKNITYESHKGTEPMEITLPATPKAIDQAINLRGESTPYGLLFTIIEGKIENIEKAEKR